MTKQQANETTGNESSNTISLTNGLIYLPTWRLDTGNPPRELYVQKYSEVDSILFVSLMI